MTLERDIVFLYFFAADDGRTTEEKIVAAVGEYAKIRNIPPLAHPAVQRTERGKPYIAGDQGIGVSVSHSGEWFVCALTEGAVGVDIEQHKQAKEQHISEVRNRFMQIAKRFFHPQEAAFVEQDPHSRFYTVWTAKESYVKYTGTGMDETFGEHCVIPLSHGEEKFSGQALPAEWQSEGVFFRQMSYPEAYTLCVCKANQFDIQIQCMM